MTSYTDFTKVFFAFKMPYCFMEHKRHFVCCLLGNSPASEFYMPTFRNTLSVPSS